VLVPNELYAVMGEEASGERRDILGENASLLATDGEHELV
jgi:hypothetical protein